MTKDQLLKEKQAKEAKIAELEKGLSEYRAGLKLINKAIAKQEKHEKEMAELVPVSKVTPPGDPVKPE